MQVLESVSQPAEQKASPKITLSPSQRKAADGAWLGLKRGDCAVLQDHGSSGKTTVLGYVHEQPGGRRMAIAVSPWVRPVLNSKENSQSKGIINEMKQMFSKLTICLVLTAMGAFAQTKPSFEVATIKPAQPIDQAQIIDAFRNGGKMPMGATISAGRAEYRYIDLKGLMVYAYGVKPNQITGPDWITTTKFDIMAKMPEGSTKEDAPKMLQSLLEERFKLTMHRTSAEHPVLALVVGKNGPKLKASAETPVAIDESVPLKPGEMKMDGPNGPVRAKIDLATGSSVTDMGLKGKMSYKTNTATQSMHIDFSMTTMAGLADMMTQLMGALGGGTGTRQIVDMTGIKGNYDASLDISPAEIMAMAKAAGMDTPMGAPIGTVGPGNVPMAADTGGGGSSVTDAVQSMGLKLEPRKAMVDQFIVDHVEKTPTEN